MIRRKLLSTLALTTTCGGFCVGAEELTGRNDTAIVEEPEYTSILDCFGPDEVHENHTVFCFEEAAKAVQNSPAIVDLVLCPYCDGFVITDKSIYMYHYNAILSVKAFI